jgi:fumarate hydratase class II
MSDERTTDVHSKVGETYRIEKDSMGEVRVPKDALYLAQTQRAVDNFPISTLRMPRTWIRALGLIKGASARANAALGLLPVTKMDAIVQAAEEVAAGDHDRHFPLDVFQTGSGTSSNMNGNEVIATRAAQILGAKVHPNDDVNMSQSSNDVIPASIHVSAALVAQEQLLPALRHLSETIQQKAAENDDVVKTGRTHLMDAMPVRLGQEFGGWAAQIDAGIARIEATLPRLHELALGGTAVGTGINAHPASGPRRPSTWPRPPVPFRHRPQQVPAHRRARCGGRAERAAQGGGRQPDEDRQRSALDELGAPRRAGRDLLEALQPGSSIMPGKINPVMPEAVSAWSPPRSSATT